MGSVVMLLCAGQTSQGRCFSLLEQRENSSSSTLQPVFLKGLSFMSLPHPQMIEPLASKSTLSADVLVLKICRESSLGMTDCTSG